MRSALFAILVVTCAACSSSGGDGPAPNPNASFTARFELPTDGAPDLLEVPFPSDLQRAADGTIALPIGTNDDPRGLNRLIPSETAAKQVGAALAHSRAFGVYGGAIFELTGGAPDRARLPKGAHGDCTSASSPIFLIDLDAGVLLECQAGWTDLAPFGETDVTPTLTVRASAGVALPEGHRVAVVLTSSLVSTDQKPLEASPTFTALRDGQRATPAAKLYGDAVDAAAAKAGIDRATIVDAAVYTTGDVTRDLFDARDLAAATPVPTLKWAADDVAPVAPARFTNASPLPAGFTASLDAWLGAPKKIVGGARDGEDDPDWDASNPGVAHDAIGAVGVAVIDAPNFLIEHDDFRQPDHHVFFHDASGKVAINPAKPTSKVWVTIVVPKAPPPTAGYPVVVYQHGGGGSRTNAMFLANAFARHGWATVGIELVMHGARASDAAARGDTKNDLARSTATYDGPDGFVDATTSVTNGWQADFLAGYLNLAAIRDHFRQTAIDHTTLVRVLRSSPALDALAVGGVTPTLDGSKIAYVGGSLGGINGAILASMESRHRAYVLNVAPAGIFYDFPFAPSTYDTLVAGSALVFGYTAAQVSPFHPLLTLGQHVVDGVEPMGLAPRVVTAPVAGEPRRNVLMIEALDEETVSNASTEALARAMGLPVIAPHGRLRVPLDEVSGAGAHDVPVTGITSALVQVAPAQHYLNIFSSKGVRDWSVADPVFDDPSRSAYTKLPARETFDQSYLAQGDLIAQFIADAFDGKAPTIQWTLAPAEPTD